MAYFGALYINHVFSPSHLPFIISPWALQPKYNVVLKIRKQQGQSMPWLKGGLHKRFWRLHPTRSRNSRWKACPSCTNPPPSRPHPTMHHPPHSATNTYDIIFKHPKNMFSGSLWGFGMGLGRGQKSRLWAIFWHAGEVPRWPYILSSWSDAEIKEKGKPGATKHRENCGNAAFWCYWTSSGWVKFLIFGPKFWAHFGACTLISGPLLVGMETHNEIHHCHFCWTVVLVVRQSVQAGVLVLC